MTDPTEDPGLLADGTYSVAPPAEDAPDDAAFTPVVELERVCLRCGYDLRGLVATGVCPECAMPVAHSLRDPLLRFSDPGYLSRLHLGSVLILLGIVGSVLGFLLSLAMNFGAAAIGAPFAVAGLETLLGFVSGGLALAGWWLLSSPDPALRVKDPGGRSRVVLRVALIIMIVGFIAESLFSLMVAYPVPGGVTSQAAMNTMMIYVVLGSIASLIEGIASLVKLFASLHYLGLLARRVPDVWLGERARHVRNFLIGLLIASLVAGGFAVMLGFAGNGGVVLMLLMAGAIGIAWLIWWLRYIGLINRFRLALALVRARVR